MNLNPIEKVELTTFIIERFKSRGIDIAQAIVDKILEISEGHPHYTQFFASEVFYLIISGKDQSQPGFNNLWLTKIINGQSDIFQNIYDQLSNIQRNVLQTLTIIDDDTELYSVKTRNKYKLPTSSTLNTALNSLINKNIIVKEGLQYKLVNPIFREWLKKLSEQL